MIRVVGTVLLLIMEHGGTRVASIPASMDAIVQGQAIGEQSDGILQLMENRMP